LDCAQLPHTTRRQALDALGGWYDDDRAGKPAPVGWITKDATQSSERAIPDHPMRDRLLDG
jgi:hypothetical protein